jgi:hypothetical protein
MKEGLVSAGPAAAVPECAPEKTEHWFQEQKQNLKTNNVSRVLEALLPHMEPGNKADDKAPVRKCHRYLTNRLDQLDYQVAIAAGLPIGSGEIVRAHRQVIQRRLKIPGAWRREDNAEHMLAPRATRANGDWCDYWHHQVAQAA